MKKCSRCFFPLNKAGECLECGFVKVGVTTGKDDRMGDFEAFSCESSKKAEKKPKKKGLLSRILG